MIHHIVHSIVHAAQHESILVLGFILIITTLALVGFIISLYVHTFYNGWKEPTLLQPLQDESPESLKRRSRLALFANSTIELDEAQPPQSLNFFRNNRFGQFALAWTLFVCSFSTIVDVSRWTSNSWYLHTHQQAPAPALMHEAPVERTS